MEDEDKITHSLRQQVQPPNKIGVEKCAAVGDSSENLLLEVNAVEVAAEVVESVGEGEKCAAVGDSSENLLTEVNAVEVAAEVVESGGEGAKMEEVDGDGVELREKGSEAGRNEVENVVVLMEEGCAVRVDEGRGNVEESVEVSMSEGEDGGGVNVEEGRGNVEENVEVSMLEGDDGGVNVEGLENVEVLVLEGKDGGVNVEEVENVEVSMSEGKGGDVDGALKVVEERRNEGGIVGELRLEGGVGVVEGVERGEVMVGGEEQGGERVEKGEVIVGGEGGEGAEKGDEMVAEKGGEGAEKRDAMVAEEGGEGAEKGDAMVEEEGGEGVEKKDAMVAEEGGEGAEKRDAMVVEEGGERVEKEGVMGEEDSEATGDGEVSPRSTIVAEVASKEETPIVDMEMESEVTKSGSGSGSGGKHRRGRIPKASASVKVPARQTVGEDVCFICLDGGSLVLCDRRACPKAYHPSCVDHDEEFFKTKGRWNCGWHICNQCGKNAYFYCYTCTFSMCKGCSKKDAVFFCVKGSKGFCETCMKTVMMIESSEPNATGLTAFDDKRNWEYLFKDYWIEQKAKLSISSEELAQAKNSLKDSGMTGREKALVELPKATNNAGTDSDSSLANVDMNDTKRKRTKRKLKPVDYDTDSSSEKEVGQARRKNRRSKSQANEASSDSEYSIGYQGSSSKRGKRAKRLSKSRSKSGGISSRGTVEWASVELMEFVMHMKNGDRSVLAPFDVQSLLLEYISRNKLRDPRRQSQILCDSMLQKLFGKPRVGHFEMLKLLESHFLLKEDAHLDNNQGSIVDTEISQLDADDHTDLYLDSGKSRGKKSRKRGEARGQSNLDDYAAIDMHNINLIYLRRCLMESLMDDSEMFHDKVVGSFIRIRISGSSQKQDIYRLVQIIGTTKAPQPYKVGRRTTDVMLEILNLDKTEIIAIDTISNQEFTEDECKRLRQSIKCGLISCMTVGNVLKKARDLQAIRVSDWLEAEVLRLGHLRDRASEKGRKKELRECVEKLQLLKTPEERQRRLDQIPEVHADPKMDPSCESDDENELHANNMRLKDSGFVRRGREHFLSRHGISVSNDSWSGNAKPPNKTRELGRNSSGKNFSNRRDDNNNPSQTSEHTWGNGVEKGTPSSNSWEKLRVIPDTSMSTREEQSGTRSDLSKAVPSESLQPVPSPANQTDVKVNETEKAWHYRDPTSKVQGPFSMAQLRKWSHTGYFPIDLRIWKISQAEDDSILLMEALAGRFRKESRSVGPTLSSMDTSKISSGRYDSSSLPSPTPSRITDALNGKQTSGSFQLSNQFQGNERLPSPTPTSPSDISYQQKGDVVVKKHENVASSTGTSQPVSGQFVLNSGPINTQHMSAQPVAHVKNQPFIPPDSAMNQTNVGQNISGTGQGFSNMIQPGNGKNQAAYSQNWGTGFVTRPETVNANLTPNNALPVKVPYNQWTGAPLSNSSPYAAGFGSPYPPGQANVAANLPSLLVNNAWRPPVQTNMPWGAQQQPVNQNLGWAGPPGAMSQSSSGTPAMGAGATNVGLTGTGPSPSPGNTKMVWATASGSASTRGGDQNRNGGGQRNLQSSSGSGGQRVCKYFREHGHCRKGSLCDYMHT